MKPIYGFWILMLRRGGVGAGGGDGLLGVRA